MSIFSHTFITTRLNLYYGCKATSKFSCLVVLRTEEEKFRSIAKLFQRINSGIFRFLRRVFRGQPFFSPLPHPLPPQGSNAGNKFSASVCLSLSLRPLLRLDLCAFLNRLVTVIASIPPANKISCHPPAIARKKRTPSVKSFFAG